MWCDHSFSQRTRQQKEEWGVGVGGNREGGVEQNLKKGESAI